MILGTQAELTCTFRDFTGTLKSPDTVTCQARMRGGFDVITLTPSEAAVGQWIALFNPDAAGTYLVRWAGTGAVMAATEMVLLVSDSQLF